jgi:hypothetical protein
MKKTLVAIASLSLASLGYALDARTHEMSGQPDLMEDLILRPLFWGGDESPGTTGFMDQTVGDRVEGFLPGEPAQPTLERLRQERPRNHQ